MTPPAQPSERPVIVCGRPHLPAIREIFNHAILHTTALYEYEPRSPAVMEAWYADRQTLGAPILGIEWEPGVLAGFATWGPFRPRPAYKYSVEHSVYVAARFRGHGIGRQLLVALVASARDRELHQLIAGIDAANAASIALHKSLGFHHCGTVREAGFKFGRWLDLEFWQLLLPTPARPVDG
ncbi:MAG: GNAT family N-acetyltransferase [Planctomycetia bacterium]|jgi:phosphinothricin acetyltransferase